MDKDKLYDLIDQDEDLTDSEKREEYFSEIDNHEMDEMERERDLNY